MGICSEQSKVFLVIRFKESLLLEKLLTGNVYEQVYHKDLFQGFLFPIYINDLKSNVKYADDSSFLFSIVFDPLETANILKNDLDKILSWVKQWKMGFNRDPTKQAPEVVFSKRNLRNFPILISTLINLWLKKWKPKNIQGLNWTKKLSFKENVKDKFVQVNRGIGISKNLSHSLLIILYKSFIRLHLDYADIIYDQPNNLNLRMCNKIETCQYNEVLAITGVIRGSSKERLCQELGFEDLSLRRCLRKLRTFYMIVRKKIPWLSLQIYFTWRSCLSNSEQ